MNTNKHIRTTLPLHPTIINQIVNSNADGTGPLSITFDLEHCKLSAHQIIGYLENIKIDCNLINFDEDLISEYISTDKFIGHTNLVDVHYALLYRFIFPELASSDDVIPDSTGVTYSQIVKNGTDVLNRTVDMVNSTPTMVMSTVVNKSPALKIIIKKAVQIEPLFANFVHLFSHDNYLISLIDFLKTGSKTTIPKNIDKMIYDNKSFVSYISKNNSLYKFVGSV